MLSVQLCWVSSYALSFMRRSYTSPICWVSIYGYLFCQQTLNLGGCDCLRLNLLDYSATELFAIVKSFIEQVPIEEMLPRVVNPYWRKRMCTVDLLVRNSSDQLLFMPKLYFYSVTKQPILMRRSTVLSLPLQQGLHNPRVKHASSCWKTFFSSSLTKKQN